MFESEFEEHTDDWITRSGGLIPQSCVLVSIAEFKPTQVVFVRVREAQIVEAARALAVLHRVDLERVH